MVHTKNRNHTVI